MKHPLFIPILLITLGNVLDAMQTLPRLKTLPSLSVHPDGVIHAINPTTTGQIGVNSVLSDLGDPVTYVGEIFGSDTQYITVAQVTTLTVSLPWSGVSTHLVTQLAPDQTTSWIGVNTAYLTIEKSSTVKIIVATATAAGNGQSVGDVSVILSEGLANALQADVSAALTTCNAPVKRLLRRYSNVRRDVTTDFATCLANAGVKAAKNGGLFDKFVEATEWEDVAVTITETLEPLIASTIASLSKVEKTKFIMYMAAAAAATGVIWETSQLGETQSAAGAVGKLNIPALGVGAATRPKVSTTSTCPLPMQTKNSESPLCGDEDCQSKNNETCVVDPNIGCACLKKCPDPKYPQPADFSLLVEQQSVIDAFSSMQPPPITTSYCSIITEKAYFTKTFCICGPSKVHVQLATSGTSTTQVCGNIGTTVKPFAVIPTGWSFIDSDNGTPVTTTQPLPPKTTMPLPNLPGPKPTSTSTFTYPQCGDLSNFCPQDA